MKATNSWITQWGLGRRMSKFQVQEAAQVLRHDAGAVREWVGVAMHTSDERVATNILRVLLYLPAGVRRGVLRGDYDVWADWAIRPDLQVRRALILAVLVDLQTADCWRPDLMDYCMTHMADVSEHISSRAYMIRLLAVMCRLYPDLRREAENLLALLPPEAPPGLLAARRRALRIMASERRGSDRHRTSGQKGLTGRQ